MMDTMSLKETVLTHPPTELSQQILDAETGIGKIKYVSHAQRSGLSIRITFVSQYQNNVILKTKREIVCHASRVMTLRMVIACSQASTTLKLLILVVLLGIGTIKSVFHAQRDGCSTIIRSACPLMITAILMMLLELAQHATKVTD